MPAAAVSQSLTRTEGIRRAQPSATINALTPLGMFMYRKDREGSITVEWFDAEGNLRALSLAEVERFVVTEGGRPSRVAGTSSATEYVNAVCGMIGTRLAHVKPELPRKDRPKLVKRILQEMARPLVGLERWQQGHGLVTIEIAREYLTRLDLIECDRLHRDSLPAW